jgi:predicted DNA-binding protein YlxM (UPF0122 family)
MASAPTATLTQVLRSISLTKVIELEKEIASFEAKKKVILDNANDQKVPAARIKCLLNGVFELFPGERFDDYINNISRFLDQSVYDATFPEKLIEDYETKLRALLETGTTQRKLAELYAKLLKEWMDSGEAEADYVSIDQRTEDQKLRLKDLCTTFETVVFEPLHVDCEKIEEQLASLFEGDSGCAEALAELRNSMASFGQQLLENKDPFDEDTVKWCVRNVLGESLLSDEKQRTLHEFLQNEVALQEIADVLNMRFHNVESWNWLAGDAGIPVLPRRDLSGKYRIWQDEDVLQAIFVNFVGVKFGVQLKWALRKAYGSGPVNMWRAKRAAKDILVRERWEFYTNHVKTADNYLQEHRTQEQFDSFCLIMLPKDVRSNGQSIYDEGEQPAANEGPKGSSTKQQLLRVAATEVFLRYRLEGNAAMIQTDFKWYATALSHDAIFTAMRFIGIPEVWVAWFKSYLEAPLNMDNACEGRTPIGPRTRRCGVPMVGFSHTYQI